MQQKTRVRRAITLIEIMIVLFLIALIGGFTAYNLRGTLDKGRAEATKIGMERLRSVLELHIAEYPQDRDRLESDWEQFVKRSPTVKDAAKLSKDAWGNRYEVRYNDEDDIEIRSTGYERYMRSLRQ